MIHESRKPFELVWRMWSMKESAYKLYVRGTQVRFFNPQKLVCTIINETKGLVKIDDSCMHTLTQMQEEYIHTNACLDAKAAIDQSIFEIKNSATLNQSQQTHLQFLQDYANVNLLSINDLAIQKTPINIPQLFYKNENINLHFSLSHHGDWGAYTILDNE